LNSSGARGSFSLAGSEIASHDAKIALVRFVPH
jgi:hypothetical protein